MKVTPMSLITAKKTAWPCLPAEVRIMVLGALVQDDGGCLAGFAIVSREWQMTIEQHNFAKINLTLSRVADFGPMILWK
jgi:hypothetical protein